MTPSDVPPFQEPWHAQIFAMTHLLAKDGVFTWLEWSTAFADTLRLAAESGKQIDEADYYGAWLETFETFLARRNLAETVEIRQIAAAWRTAYSETPHGMPVIIKK